MNGPIAMTEAWQAARPEIVSTWRDLLVLVNLLSAIGIVQLMFLGLRVLHVDPDLIQILEFGHKWTTIAVVFAFFATVILRAIAVAWYAGRKSEA